MSRVLVEGAEGVFREYEEYMSHGKSQCQGAVSKMVQTGADATST